MVGKVGHLNNGQVVDGTATSDANAAAAHILTGKSAYVNGQKINGSMPDYTSFPLVCRYTQTYNMTLDTDSDEFPLQAFDLHGGTIKTIQISCGSFSLTTTSSATSRYIASLLYSADSLLMTAAPTSWLGLCVRCSRTSTTAHTYVTSGGGSYFSLLNENLLASGGASIKSVNTGTLGFFRAGLTYHVMVGGG